MTLASSSDLGTRLTVLARLQGQLLREESCGHPDWYAEMLVAAACDGRLMPTNNPLYDLRCPRWGRVQVKCRVHGTDTTQNRSNFGRYRADAFDHAAIVLFEPSFKIRGAVVLPCGAVLGLVRAAGHVKWDDSVAHPRAVSIADELRRISGE